MRTRESVAKRCAYGGGCICGGSAGDSDAYGFKSITHSCGIIEGKASFEFGSKLRGNSRLRRELIAARAAMTAMIITARRARQP